MHHNESLLDGFISAGAITFPWWFDYVAVSAELYILLGGIALITLRVIKATHDYIKGRDDRREARRVQSN